MRVGVRVCRSKRVLSQRVSLEVSSDACTGGGSQDFFLFKFLVLFGYKGTCILVCFLTRNISMEEDVSCESAWNKLQKIADTLSMLFGVYASIILNQGPRQSQIIVLLCILTEATLAQSNFFHHSVQQQDDLSENIAEIIVLELARVSQFSCDIQPRLVDTFLCESHTKAQRKIEFGWVLVSFRWHESWASSHQRRSKKLIRWCQLESSLTGFLQKQKPPNNQSGNATTRRVPWWMLLMLVLRLG